MIIFRKVLSFLRLVSPPPHLPVFFAECVTSRPLCAQGLPSIQSPSKAHASERSGQRSNVLRFVHPRIQPREDPFPTRRHIKGSSPRDRPRRGFAQCLTRGEHGFVLRRRAAPFQRLSSYVPLLGLVGYPRRYVRACSQGTMWLLGRDPSSRLTLTSSWVSTLACGPIRSASVRGSAVYPENISSRPKTTRKTRFTSLFLSLSPLCPPHLASVL